MCGLRPVCGPDQMLHPRIGLALGARPCCPCQVRHVVNGARGPCIASPSPTYGNQALESCTTSAEPCVPGSGPWDSEPLPPQPVYQDWVPRMLSCLRQALCARFGVPGSHAVSTGLHTPELGPWGPMPPLLSPCWDPALPSRSSVQGHGLHGSP